MIGYDPIEEIREILKESGSEDAISFFEVILNENKSMSYELSSLNKGE